MRTTCDLRIPTKYVVMDNDEMEYADGGYTYYTQAQCNTHAANAWNQY